MTRPRTLHDIGGAHTGVMSFDQPSIEATSATFNTNNSEPLASSNRSATLQPSLPWPSVASDAHDPGFRLPGLGASSEAIRTEHVTVVAEMLVQLGDLATMGRLLQEYYEHSPTALVPALLVCPILDTLADKIPVRQHHDSSESDETILRVAERIVESTAARVKINKDLTPTSFCASYTEDSLRLEAIGLVFALAGRSCVLAPGHEEEMRKSLLHTMFRCSTCCLQIAREVASEVIDPLVWLSHENLLLTMSVQGDAGPNVWRRLGDLSTDVYALGIHKESTHVGKSPSFLSECRRRAFAAAYQVDKMICVFFDRPPRILRRYADCKMPLDLADDQCLGDDHDLEEARGTLDSGGWSAEPRYTSSTWARLCYILGIFREEVLEFPFRPFTPENRAKLINLSERSQQSWQSLPEHLKYTPQCWTSNLDASTCFLLATVHLSHLQNEFQIQRLLRGSDPATSTTLLDVSAEIVATVVQLGKTREKAPLLRSDFPYLVVNYGLHSAAVLTAALQTKSGHQQRLLPENISRSALIRSLMVFASQLEGIGIEGQVIHITCMQASKAISRTLDEVLDDPPPVPGATSGSIASIPALTSHDAFDMPSSPSQIFPAWRDNVDFDPLGMDALEGFDLSGLASSAAWTGNGFG